MAFTIAKCILLGIAAFCVLFVAAAVATAASTRPSLTMYSQDGCAPCKRAKQVLDAYVSAGALDGVSVRVVDIRQDTQESAANEIRVTPTFIVRVRGGAVLVRTPDVKVAIGKAREARR
jgi:glutaredoxin